MPLHAAADTSASLRWGVCSLGLLPRLQAPAASQDGAHRVPSPRPGAPGAGRRHSGDRAPSCPSVCLGLTSSRAAATGGASGRLRCSGRRRRHRRCAAASARLASATRLLAGLILPLTPSLQYTWMGGAINRARKRLNVPYPNLYAPPGELGARGGAAPGAAHSRLAGTAAGRAGTALSESVWRSEQLLVRAHQWCATLAWYLSRCQPCRPPAYGGWLVPSWLTQLAQGVVFLSFFAGHPHEREFNCIQRVCPFPPGPAAPRSCRLCASLPPWPCCALFLAERAPVADGSRLLAACLVLSLRCCVLLTHPPRCFVLCSAHQLTRPPRFLASGPPEHAGGGARLPDLLPGGGDPGERRRAAGQEEDERKKEDGLRHKW